MTYLIQGSGFGALFPTPQPRYITDGDIAALIPADVKRTGKHKADKLPWRVERYVQPPMTMTTSAMDEDVEFDANGNVVSTTWNIYLGKHRVKHCRNLAGVKTYFTHHTDKREVYDAHMEAKKRRKQERREQAKRDKYLRIRTKGQAWADSWSECTGYGDSTPKSELEWLISYAPDDFDTTVLTDALASIEEALRAYHAAQR